MTTRPELRAAMRQRLLDTHIESHWSEQQLNDAIAEGIRRYSTRLPTIQTWVPVVPVDAWEIFLPCHIDPLKVVRVKDDLEVPWRRWHPVDEVPPPLPYGWPAPDRSWRVWAGAILLSRPVERTGLWQVDYARLRVVPENDACPVDVDAGDAPIVIAQAVAVLLHREAVKLGKVGRYRSDGHRAVSAVRAAQMDADRLMDLRTRGV